VSTLVSGIPVSALTVGFHGAQLVYASGSVVFALELATGSTLTLAGSVAGSLDGSCSAARFSSSIACIASDATTSDLLLCDAGSNLVRRVSVDGNVGSCVLTAISTSLNAAFPVVAIGGVNYFGLAGAAVVGDKLFAASLPGASLVIRSLPSGALRVTGPW
jgi:hypothetical protein